jgi:tetratricopeptide (TPR) repeat protein
VAAATHYTKAERYPEAAQAYQHASDSARRRGALNEARTHLGSAISQIERQTPSAERDRAEVGLRLRRGFLIYAAEGVWSTTAAAEFERCLEITGLNFTDELFATLIALYAYYAMRADLQRVDQLLGSLRATLDAGREWFRPFNTAGFGMLAWYRGEFENAMAYLEDAAAARSDENAPELEAVWFMPNEGVASIHTHLALARYILGDLAGAEQDLQRAARRCDEIDFPQGAFSLGYAKQMEFLIRIEAEQFDEAAAVADDLITIGEQHGFDSWRLAGTAQRATADALQALRDATLDPGALEAHIAVLTGYVDAWRALGAVVLITYYDAVLARLLIAAGLPDAARERIELGLALAEETGMRCHNAELLRLRAKTRNTDDERRADLVAAIELARTQGAAIYELRSAIDEFEAQGGSERLNEAIKQFAPESTWPQLAHARTLLE